MIDFKKYQLPNGLTVILHRDESTPLVAVNVLYKIGSRNENPKRTGFAHLFEHLMFGGSANVPDFDTPIQDAGGENNAFTNSDLTNFYNVLPKENLEVALWLESDRMKQLDFGERSLEVQKKVVIEEFSETCINQPYGDLWHELSDLTYKQHPYRWPTIGITQDHIKEAELSDVSDFFERYYKPSNAVLVIAGNFDFGEASGSIEKWFGEINGGNVDITPLPEEPPQEEYRFKLVESNIPSDALFMAFHMPDRLHPDFPAFDLLSDIFSGGRSGRFYQRLIKGSTLFSNVNAYLTGTIDPGLFIVEAKLMQRDSHEQAADIIWKELNQIKIELVSEDELQKVKNGIISSIEFSEVSIIHKAINLAYYEMLGDASLINEQTAGYIRMKPEDLMRLAKQTFQKDNCSELWYKQK